MLRSRYPHQHPIVTLWCLRRHLQLLMLLFQKLLVALVALGKSHRALQQQLLLLRLLLLRQVLLLAQQHVLLQEQHR